MTQPLFEHRLELAGYETRVLELEGDGVPVVMFHGYADSADTWRQSLALLGRRGRRAIAVDLPGFGAADPLGEDAVLPQLDAFAKAAVPSAAAPGVVSTFGAHHRDKATVAASRATARRLIRELRKPFQLDRISSPVLLVWGDRDRLVFHRGAQPILDAVAGSRLELL